MADEKAGNRILDGDITEILSKWKDGHSDALSDLMPLVYKTLKNAASYHLDHNAGDQTLQPTAVINEVYIRLSEKSSLNFPDRARFFGFAGKLIRNILVDYARNRQSQKRGSGQPAVSLDESLGVAVNENLDPSTLIALDDALTELAQLDERQSRIVELRFFAGFSIDEITTFLEVSRATVQRELKMAKHWLARKLRNR